MEGVFEPSVESLILLIRKMPQAVAVVLLVCICRVSVAMPGSLEGFNRVH
jgi:hypothetical protein